MTKSYLFTLIFLILSCSKDNISIIDEQAADACSLYLMKCAVPFLDESYEPVFPQSDIIVVGGTTLDSVKNAIAKIKGNEKSLFFPSGTYKIPVLRNIEGNITNRTILSFAESNGLEIFGESGTILQLDFEHESSSDLGIIRDKQVSLLTIVASENVYIHDLTLKGNFEFTGNSADTLNFHTEHRNILIRDSNSVYLYDLTSTNSEGDAITITASSNQDDTPNYTSDIYVKNVTVDNLNRNGVSLAGAGIINNVLISKSSFGGKVRTQQLDFEPTANVSNNLNITNVDIWDNTFNKLELSSNRASQGAISILTREGKGIECIFIRDNVINNDIQILKGASSITLINNSNIPSLVITNNVNTININDNMFNLNMTTERAFEREGAGILIANRIDSNPSEIKLFNNNIKKDILATEDNVTKAILLKNADRIAANSNIIDFSDSAQSSIANSGISLHFEDNNGLENMNFTNVYNSFSGINSENQIELSGEVERIVVNTICN